MANNINDAARGAADWLINLAKKEAKFNPMPFGLFKSSINKQISWANQVGVSLSFEAVALLVRARLNKAGIQVLQEDKRKGWGFKDYPQDILEGTTQGTTQQETQEISFSLSSLQEKDFGAAQLFAWLHEVFCNAQQIKPDCIRFSVHFLGGSNYGQGR